MKHGSLFSGIGGFDLAAEWMGWDNMFHCEINDFCKKVLKHYWPNATSYHDIKQTDFTIWRGRIDILTGGFPCQPYSTAGLRKGKDDERHLWPEMLRAIREIQPGWIVGENVRGLTNWNGGMVFDEVQADLETEGYEVIPFLLPAAGVNAPHRRDRIWFVANNTSQRFREAGADISRPTKWNTGDGDERITTNATLQRERPGQQGKPNERRSEQLEIAEQRRNGNHDAETRVIADSNCHVYSGRLDSGRNSAASTRSETTGKQQGECEENGEWSRLESGPSRENVANTDIRRLERGESKTSRQKPVDGISWSQFPTQPPICSGNDGFPAGVDGITFSKWRNESIKAAGNAIVPQVVYQIFKSIQQYETL